MKRTWHYLALALFCCLLPGFSGAAEGEPGAIPVEAFFKHQAVLDARLSPSGKYLAVQMARGFSRASLLVFDLRGEAAPKLPVSYGDVDVLDFSWISDERLMYRVGELDASPVGRPPTLYAVDVDGKNRRPIRCGSFGTCGDTPYYQWLHVPLASSAGHAGEIVAGQRSSPSHRGRSFSWLNTYTGALRSMDVPALPRDVEFWWFNSKGAPILALSRHLADEKLALYRLDSAERVWREWVSFPSQQMPYRIIGAADDGRVYVVVPRGAAGELVLTTLDIATGMPVEHTLLASPGFDFDGHVIKRGADGAVIGFTAKAESAVTLWMTPEMKALQAEIDELLPGRVNQIQCSGCDKTPVVVLVRSYSDRDPGRFLIYRGQSRPLQEVAVVRPDIDSRLMATVELHRISARDGRPLPVWLTLPRDVGRDKPLPTVVLVHGGPWMRGRQWEWDGMGQFLASRGYVVIEPEFRGSDGYGEAHLKAGFRQWGLSMQDDLTDALAWARREGYAGERACIMGGSYGGYAALMGLVKDPEQYRCGVVYAVVSDLMLFLDGSGFVGDDDAVNWGRRDYLPERVGRSSRDGEKLIQTSPVAQAERIRAPLLLAHGIYDRRATFAQGTRMRDALIKAGRPVQWIEYENEGHAWRVQTQIDFAKKVEIFLAEYLKKTAP